MEMFGKATLATVVLLLVAVGPVSGQIIFSSDVEDDGTWDIDSAGSLWSTTGWGYLSPFPIAGSEAWVGNGLNHYTWADVGTTVQAGQYTVTGSLGNFSNFPFPTTVFNIRAGATNLNLDPYEVSATTPVPAPGAWETWTKTYDVPPTAAEIGQPLTAVVWLQDPPASNAAFDGPYTIDYTAPPPPVPIITPVFATGTPASYGSPTLLINGAGLLGGSADIYQPHETTHTQGWLKDNTDPANELIFTMPAASDLDGMHVWQYSQGTCCTGRGVSTFDIAFSTDGGATYATSMNLGPLDAASGTSYEMAQLVSFAEQTGVTHVKISGMVPPGGAGGSWQGLNEVRFQGTLSPGVIDITPAWNAANHARVFIGGGGDQAWINYDNGQTTDAFRQQWVWMDVGTDWLSQIPAGEEIESAVLTFGPSAFQAGSQGSNYSIFEVPGADAGRAGIIAFNGAGRDGDELPDYYAGNAAYGQVTAADINGAAPIRFDITALMQRWTDGSPSTNPGQMMILSDVDVPGDGSQFAWVNWNGAGPMILLTTAPSTAPPPQLTDGLMAYWNFDEAPSATFEYGDVAVRLGSGNVDDSTFSGGGDPANILGKVGPGALHLDGDDVVYANFSQDIGQAAGSPNSITTAMSVQAWVHVESLDGRQNILAKRHTNNTDGWVLEAYESNLTWWLDNEVGPVGWNFVTAPDAAADNLGEWAHVVLTWESGDKMRMYVNGGAPFESADDVGGTINLWNDLLGFGAWSGVATSYYTGALDEVAIWNRQLSANEVAVLYNDGAGRSLVPEPSTFVLAGLGLLGLSVVGWRRRKR